MGIIWAIFNGGLDVSGKGKRYIDDGETTGYEDGVYAQQTLDYSLHNSVLTIDIKTTSNGQFQVKSEFIGFELRTRISPIMAIIGGSKMDCKVSEWLLCTSGVRMNYSGTLKAQ